MSISMCLSLTVVVIAYLLCRSPEKAVKEEMQFAIREAMKSAEPEAITFWKAVAPDGKEPPIEKVIAMIALNVNNRMYN